MLDALKELLQREPFVAFRIVLTSGDGYEVSSPFQVAIGQSKLNYFYPRSDRWAILDQKKVAAYEVSEEAAH